MNDHQRHTSEDQAGKPNGISKTYLILLVGHTLSIFGTMLTEFGLAVWVLEETESVTQYTLISFFALLPLIVVSPFAGAIVDRNDRRKLLIFSDSIAALGSLALIILLLSDSLAVWHVYVITILGGVANAFQMPAFIASVTMLVGEKQLARANGLREVGRGIAFVSAPMMAGFLYPIVGLMGIILIDGITFLIAVISLIIIAIPNPKIKKEGTTVTEDMADGNRFLLANKGLLIFIILIGVNSYVEGVFVVMFKPLLLEFSSPTGMGVALAVGGAGALLGSAILSWRGEKIIPVKTTIALIMLQGGAMAAFLFFGAGQAHWLLICSVVGALFFLAQPVIRALSQTVIQTRVPAEMQGRITSLSMVSMVIAFSSAYLFSGPLVDYLFEPLMQSENWLSTSLGGFIGQGEGSGIVIFFALHGLINLAIAFVALFHAGLRGLDAKDQTQA